MPDIAAWKVLHTPERIQELHFNTPPHSINDVSRQLPGGVYTTLRTYGRGRILPLEDQLRRLEESARLVKKPVLIDRNQMREALAWALRRFPGGEARIRISVDPEACPGEIYLALEPLATPPDDAYQRGVLVVTVPLRRVNPVSKQVHFIETAEAIRHTIPPDANEALMVDERGNILEGLSSNFFAVIHGKVWTADEGVLPGITRALVLEAVHKIGLPLRFESVPVAGLSILEEAFLTSSTRAVLAVRQIDEIVIGSGTPGPITKRLMAAYWVEVEKRLEDGAVFGGSF